MSLDLNKYAGTWGPWGQGGVLEEQQTVQFVYRKQQFVYRQLGKRVARYSWMVKEPQNLEPSEPWILLGLLVTMVSSEC